MQTVWSGGSNFASGPNDGNLMYLSTFNCEHVCYTITMLEIKDIVSKWM